MIFSTILPPRKMDFIEVKGKALRQLEGKFLKERWPQIVEKFVETSMEKYDRLPPSDDPKVREKAKESARHRFKMNNDYREESWEQYLLEHQVSLQMKKRQEEPTEFPVQNQFLPLEEE
jgi:hypothetical protein